MTEMLKECIKHKSFINASPEKIYEIITSADGWNAFFTTGLEIDPKPGGRMVWRWKDWGPDYYDVEAEAEVVETLSPFKFAFKWYPVGKEYPTLITFTLTQKHGGTVVEVTEKGYPDTSKGRQMILECACGWAEAVTLLKFYLEKGVVYSQPEKEE
jgi:uncharacterized protein YndB with AHSA1/START domain